jgi:acetyl esterase/lipase
MPERGIPEVEVQSPRSTIRRATQAAGAALLSAVAMSGPVPGVVAEADAALYSEYTPPAGAQKGVVLLMHGGGWSTKSVGKKAVDNPYVQKQAAFVRSAGYASLNIDYRPGRKGILDVVGSYNKARMLARGGAVCVWGSSAGAHEALMLDEVPLVKPDCIITEGAPVDLTQLRGPTRQLALDAFALKKKGAKAENALWHWSPARRLSSINARLLVGHAQADTAVNVSQADILRRVPGADVQTLNPGTEQFTHGFVDRNQLIRFRMSEFALLQSAAQQKQAR